MILHQYHCPNCSATLSFLLSFSSNIVTCEYCGSKFSLDQGPSKQSVVSNYFDSGNYSECIQSCSKNLHHNHNDAEALFYRGMSLLFLFKEDYQRFDTTVLNVLERSTTPVAEEKMIYGDIHQSWGIDKSYIGMYYHIIIEYLSTRERYFYYRKDLEYKILCYAKTWHSDCRKWPSEGELS